MKSFVEIIKFSFLRTIHTIKYFPLIFATMIVMKLSLNISNNIFFRLSLNKNFTNIIIGCLIVFLVSILFNMLSISVHTRENYHIQPITIPKLMLKIGFNSLILFGVYHFIKNNDFALFVSVFILNPLIETLYMIDERFYMSMITALKFTVKNFFVWNIPNIIIFAVIYQIIFKYYLVEDLMMSNEINSVLKFGILLILISLFMLYRANLYRILETGEK